MSGEDGERAEGGAGGAPESPAGEETGARNVPWYRSWFGPEYLELYPHRDQEEAERAVELFLEHAALPEGARVLDLACGEGRHLRAIRRRGRRAVGLDLSISLLRRAREGPDGVRLLAQGDMRRIPFRSGAFRAVTSFFTSFGYFESPSEDRRVLAEIRRVLARGGAFLLDYMNAERVRRTLVPVDERRVAGRTVRQVRRIRDGAVEKRIEIQGPEREEPAVFHERVRLYAPGELVAALKEEGFTVDRRFGDYSGSEHTSRSPRLILVGSAR